MTDTERPHVVITYKNDVCSLSVDGVDLSKVARAGSVKINFPAQSGQHKRPSVTFTVMVDDFELEGDALAEVVERKRKRDEAAK